jgi:hypothetical protein
MKLDARVLVTLFLAAIVAACADDAVGPDPQVTLLSGTYSAEGVYGAFAVTTTGPGAVGTIDWVARGAFIRLDLHADGTTSGRFFVPGADEDGGDLDADLAGTWSVAAGVIRLAQEADTVLRDMEFRLVGSHLLGDWSGSDESVRIELERR